MQEIGFCSLLANSPTFNPDDSVDINGALAGEDFGYGDDENSWSIGGK